MASFSGCVKTWPAAVGGGEQPIMSPESAYTPSSTGMAAILVPHSRAKKARAEAFLKSQSRTPSLPGGHWPGAEPTQSSQNPWYAGSSTMRDMESKVTAVQKADV